MNPGRWRAALVAVLLAVLAVRPAHAADDDIDEHTLSGQGPRLKPVHVTAGEPPGSTWQDRPLAARSAEAATLLRSAPTMVDRAAQALELVFRRDYPTARRQLDQLSADYPTSGIGPFGVAVIYQALMFENFDFRYERQYELARDQVKAQIDLGARLPGDEAFEWFLLAGIQGIDAIHALRKGDYLASIGRALEATRSLAKTRERAPTFADPQLGDGLYLYWRTVAASQSKLVPDFGDRRAEGIALMKEAEARGAFVGPAATLALAYAYIEERDPRAALDRCLYAQRGYPDNVINTLTLGRVYTSMGRLDDALAAFDRVLAVAPTNQRVHYFRGVVYGRRSEWALARASYQRYLEFPDPPADARGSAWYRLGSVYLREKNYPQAEACYRSAIDVSGNDLARGALRRMKRKGWAP